jgi:hypothetical protein
VAMECQFPYGKKKIDQGTPLFFGGEQTFIHFLQKPIKYLN